MGGFIVGTFIIIVYTYIIVLIGYILFAYFLTKVLEKFVKDQASGKG